MSSHFDSIEHVVTELADAHYIADRALATVLFLAHRLEKPIFLEGEPGVGKTEVAIVMLNPLAGDPDYQPVCQGMRIALSYVDYFLPADSLQSLKQVGRLLSRVMIH